jgi:hypothetical protein
MPGVDDRDPAGEVDVTPTFDIPHFAVECMIDKDLMHLPDAARDRRAPARHQRRVAQTGLPLHNAS